MAYPNYGQWSNFPSQMSPSATAYASQPGFGAYGQQPLQYSQPLTAGHPGGVLAPGQHTAAHPGGVLAQGQPAAAHPGGVLAQGQPAAAHPGYSINPQYMVQNPGTYPGTVPQYPGQAMVHPGIGAPGLGVPQTVGASTLRNPPVHGAVPGVVPGAGQYPGSITVQGDATIQRANTLPRPSVLPPTSTAARPSGLPRTVIVPDSNTSQGTPQYSSSILSPAATLPRTMSSSVYAPVQPTSVPAASQIPAQPPQTYVPPSPTTTQPEPPYQGPIPGAQYGNTPLGIQNNGENICFMNSVLQCLSRSPSLVPGLTKNKKMFRGTSAMVTFANAVTELMEHLAVLPGMTYGSGAVANPDAVRRAASALPGTMVAPPKGPQQQQDAAEFLMWLLDALHSVLKAGSVVTKGKTAETGKTIDRLKTLRFIYGDESPQRINKMKETAKKEIEKAGGLDVRGYAEAVQRLTDLEWLTYKKAEQSHVDDLFTGQHIEAFNCTNCSRMSINIQTFKILPVPVGQLGQPYSVLQLEDCFSSFGKLENLVGQDGLRCPCMNKTEDSRYSHGLEFGQDEWSSGATPISQTLQGLAQLKHAGLGVKKRPQLSEHTFKTPHGVRIKAGPQSTTRSSVKLCDGQRRSLLRQLPECLIIQLMRFSHSGGQQVKLHDTVKLPLTGLDLTPYVIDTVMQQPDLIASSPYQYDLYALCLHIGADMTALGHYIAYSQSQDGVWYRYDDSQVSPVNIEYELNTRLVCENVYLAFYRRSHTTI